MGCHTWFNNKLNYITDNDIKKLKDIALSNIEGQTIMKHTYSEWASIVKGWKVDNKTKMKFTNREFWNDRINHLKWSKSVLETADPNYDTLLSVLKEFGGLVYEDAYDLSRMGWGDNFRVYGYPEGTFESAEEAKKFLENYDQDKIEYKKEKGYSDKIGEIIDSFFKEYPNGYIEYG